MSGFAESRQEDQMQELMELLEVMQEEIDQKDKIINELQMQLQESLELSEKLNKENKVENVQELKNDLKKTRELLQNEKKKVYKAKSEAEEFQDKLKKEVQARIFAQTHQKIIEKVVEKPVFYDRCIRCERTLYQKAREKYEQSCNKLEDRYIARIMAFYVLLVGNAGYSLLTTFFAAIRCNGFANDFIEFFKTVSNLIIQVVVLFLSTSRYVAQVGKKISNETAANIIYWLIFIIFAGVVFTFVIIGICFVFIKLKDFYQDNCGDLISVMVATFSMALLIYFGDWMKGLMSVNLIVIFLLIQIVYMAVRYCINASKTIKGYY